MTTRDPYDVTVAFDDLFDDDTAVLGGADDDRLARWVALAKDRIFRRQRVRGDDVRLDDAESYDQFRAWRRWPYLQSLDTRLRNLETEFRQHIADGHGAPVTVLGDAAVRTIDTAARGGVAIPLPCCADGAVECWLDGADLLCTVRFMAPDGVRAATASAPAAPAVNEVVGAAWESGIDWSDVKVLGGTLASLVGADALVTAVCGIVVDYLDGRGRVFDASVRGNRYLHGCDVLTSSYGGAA
jgi:hypothetical protein